METKKNKVVEFVKNHKKQIAIAAGMVAVGGLVIAKTRAKDYFNVTMFDTYSELKADCPGFENIIDAWTEKQADGATYVNVIVDNLTAADFGKVGEDVIQKFKDVKPDTVVSAVVGFKVG